MSMPSFAGLVSLLRRHPRIARGASAVGLILGISIAWGIQVYYLDQGSEEKYPLWSYLLWALGFWLSWLAVYPPIARLARRFPPGPDHTVLHVLIHLAGSFVISFVHLALQGGFAYVTTGGKEGAFAEGGGFFRVFLGLNHFFRFVIYVMFVVVTYSIDYYRKFRERETRASLLEAQLTQAQLQTLRMQLHPHFLFNTLNAIAGLVRKNDNTAAVQMITGLSDLLRYTLDHVQAQEVSLQQEMEMLHRYLGIQQVRFHDRMTVAIDLPSTLLDARVPSLILQPLVENAVRHGISSRSTAGVITVRARQENGLLIMEVEDNGPGLPPPGEPRTGTGVGIANTRARLLQLYGDAGSLHLGNIPSGGVVATVIIPFRNIVSQHAG